MPISATSAVRSGEFSDFLQAELGQESNGMSLSLLSALTRLGFDPWQEAERLAGLPEKKAVAALATIIARAVSALAAPPADPPSLAERIIQLLPKPGQAAPAAETRGRDSSGLLATLVSALGGLPRPESLRWWVIAATLALALAANLWW